MDNFGVKIRRVVIGPHPDADRLELAHIDGYVSVVGKGAFKSGDLVAYIPEKAIVPERVLERIGLVGKLAGSKKNRVKPMELRGVLSQGICYPVESMIVNGELRSYISIVAQEEVFDGIDVQEGDDVTEFLGVTKYVPIPPASMDGELAPGLYDSIIPNYEFNDIKSMPGLFEEGEDVVITEKIHGTFMVIGILPQHVCDEHGLESRFYVASKGLAHKGFTFRLDGPNQSQNIYVRTAFRLGLFDALDRAFGHVEIPVAVMGELYGSGVQDLTYGLTRGEMHFRAFDIVFGYRAGCHFSPHSAFCDYMGQLRFQTVPFVYRGPFSEEVLRLVSDGVESVSSFGLHMREGVVVKSAVENRHRIHGRKIAKSYNPAYLTRKGGTEYH